jgi:hypothetical protein
MPRDLGSFRRLCVLAACSLWLAASVQGQSPKEPAPPVFEVASVKPNKVDVALNWAPEQGVDVMVVDDAQQPTAD